MELTGKIKAIADIQTFASGFQKREMVLTTNEQYPQPICIEFLHDNIDLLNKLKVGDDVKVGINIRGREWTSPQGEVKFFNSIVGWKVEKQHDVLKTEVASENPEIFEEENDDLPF